MSRAAPKMPRTWSVLETRLILPSELSPRKASVYTLATWVEPNSTVSVAHMEKNGPINEVGTPGWSFESNLSSRWVVSPIHEQKVSQLLRVGYKHAFGTKTETFDGSFQDAIDRLLGKDRMGPFWHTYESFICDLSEWVKIIDEKLEIKQPSLLTISLEKARLEAELAELEYTASQPMYGTFS